MGNKCETGNVKRFFLLLLGSFLSLSAWAQTGVICGTVSDAKFKDALIGASVVIEGTTVGAIADVEGNFRIENVKPGKYTIVASYVSYKSETIRDVVVKAHQESVLRIELSDADLQLQNVVVVAQRKLGTEKKKGGKGTRHYQYGTEKPTGRKRYFSPTDRQDTGQ